MTWANLAHPVLPQAESATPLNALICKLIFKSNAICETSNIQMISPSYFVSIACLNCGRLLYDPPTQIQIELYLPKYLHSDNPSQLSNPECDIRENFDTNECPNIFVSTKWHEWISEYIHINLFDTNECPNKYLYWKLHEYSNIFKYSCNFRYKYLFGHSFVSKKLIWIYSDIHSCNFVDTNIFGHSFVSKFSRMSHSDLEQGGTENISGPGIELDQQSI